MAARWGHHDVVELLLSYGADPGIEAEVEVNVDSLAAKAMASSVGLVG